MYYNADLMNTATYRQDIGQGFIDDVVLGTKARSDAKNASKLEPVSKEAEK